MPLTFNSALVVKAHAKNMSCLSVTVRIYTVVRSVGIPFTQIPNISVQVVESLLRVLLD